MSLSGRGPISAPPGWYPDPGGSGRFRWWDGAWTPHLSGAEPLRPMRRLRSIGVLFLVPLLAIPFVLLLAIYGDPYPVSRAGVAAGPDGLEVVNAICPGEQLTGIRLVRLGEPGSSPTTIWQVTGSAPLHERLVVGSPIEGLTTDVAFVDSAGGADSLVLYVYTSDIGSPYYPLEFQLSEVPSVGVLSYGATYSSFDEFSRASLRDTRCGDPSGKQAQFRIFLWYLAVAGPIAVVGLVLLGIDHRRFNAGQA